MSNAFGSKVPAHPHLVRGQGGLAGEIADLRKDTDEAFDYIEDFIGASAVGAFFGRVGIQGADDDGIKTSIASVAAPVTYSGADFNGVFAPGSGHAIIDVPKKVTVLIGGTGADWLGGNVVVTGTDADGAVLQETVVSAADVGTTTTLGYFATVDSIALPAAGNTGATVKLGAAAAPECIMSGVSALTAQDLTANSAFKRASVGNRIMSNARKLSVVFSSHANWDATTMTIYGVDANGDAIQEDIAIPNNGNATVAGVKYFKQVTRVTVPIQSGGSGTFTIGIADTTVGLPREIIPGALAAVVIKELSRADSAASWSDPTDGTITVPASALPNGAYTPNTAPNGAIENLLIYVAAP